jgi:uncharacterized membrane protein (DUF485 family)
MIETLLFIRKILSRRFTQVLLTLPLVLIFFYFGKNVSFAKQWPLYDALRNTASIVFGVMGAWIALIYPDALSEILGKSHDSRDMENGNKIKEVKKLFSPLIYSTFILIFVLLIGIFAPIFKQIPLFINNRDLMRGISYVCLGILTPCQLWAVFLTLVPADFANQNLDYLHERQEVRKRLLSGTRTNLKSK